MCSFPRGFPIILPWVLYIPGLGVLDTQYYHFVVCCFSFTIKIHDLRRVFRPSQLGFPPPKKKMVLIKPYENILWHINWLQNFVKIENIWITELRRLTLSHDDFQTVSYRQIICPGCLICSMSGRSISFSTGVGHHLSFWFQQPDYVQKMCLTRDDSIFSYGYLQATSTHQASSKKFRPSQPLAAILAPATDLKRKNENRGSIHKDGFPQQKKVNNLKKCKLAAHCLLDQKIENEVPFQRQNVVHQQYYSVCSQTWNINHLKKLKTFFRGCKCSFLKYTSDN